MSFDPTITFGAVLIVLGQVSTVIWFAARLDKRIDMLSLKLDNLDDRVDSQAETIRGYAAVGERFAKAEGRLDSIETMSSTTQREVADLRRGRGWIQKDGRDGLAGQYG